MRVLFLNCLSEVALVSSVYMVQVFHKRNLSTCQPGRSSTKLGTLETSDPYRKFVTFI